MCTAVPKLVRKKNPKDIRYLTDFKIKTYIQAADFDENVNIYPPGGKLSNNQFTQFMDSPKEKGLQQAIVVFRVGIFYQMLEWSQESSQGQPWIRLFFCRFFFWMRTKKFLSIQRPIRLCLRYILTNSQVLFMFRGKRLAFSN